MIYVRIAIAAAIAVLILVGIAWHEQKKAAMRDAAAEAARTATRLEWQARLDETVEAMRTATIQALAKERERAAALRKLSDELAIQQTRTEEANDALLEQLAAERRDDLRNRERGISVDGVRRLNRIGASAPADHRPGPAAQAGTGTP